MKCCEEGEMSYEDNLAERQSPVVKGITVGKSERL